jgi:hypothetical protein
MDVEDYRRQYESTLTAAARPLGPDDREAALATARDKAADLQSRLDAVASVSNWAASQEDALDALLAILRDSSEPAELRSATITGLEMNRFRAIKFQPKMADYTQALHEVVHEAPDEELLDQSLEALASQQDPEIQNRLVQGLADPSVAITSPQRSVELLAYDP